MKPTDPPAATHPADRHSPGAQGHAPHHYTPEELHNEDVAHEHSDINIRAIVISALTLGAIGVIVAALMYGVFGVLDEQARRNDPEISPLAPPAVQMPPSTVESPVFGTAPEPQLLTNEYAYLQRQRQAEQQQLTGYGWVDQGAGVARIPIEEAKRLLAERGLPVRADGAADPTMGTNRPARGEASSGRIVDGLPRGTGLPELGGGGHPPEQRQRAPQKDRE